MAEKAPAAPQVRNPGKKPQWQAGEGLLGKAEVQQGLLGKRVNSLSSVGRRESMFF